MSEDRNWIWIAIAVYVGLQILGLFVSISPWETVITHDLILYVDPHYTEAELSNPITNFFFLGYGDAFNMSLYGIGLLFTSDVPGIFNRLILLGLPTMIMLPLILIRHYIESEDLLDTDGFWGHVGSYCAGGVLSYILCLIDYFITSFFISLAIDRFFYKGVWHIVLGVVLAIVSIVLAVITATLLAILMLITVLPLLLAMALPSLLQVVAMFAWWFVCVEWIFPLVLSGIIEWVDDNFII